MAGEAHAKKGAWGVDWPLDWISNEICAMRVIPNDKSMFWSSLRLLKGKNTVNSLMLMKNEFINETNRIKNASVKSDFCDSNAGSVMQIQKKTKDVFKWNLNECVYSRKLFDKIITGSRWLIHLEHVGITWTLISNYSPIELQTVNYLAISYSGSKNKIKMRLEI